MQQHAPSSSSKPRKQHTFRSKAQWRVLINQYENSAQTQKVFCEQHGIAVSSFHQWRNRFKQDEIVSNDDFIDMTPKSEVYPSPRNTPSESPWLLELDLGQGMTLRLRQS